MHPHATDVYAEPEPVGVRRGDDEEWRILQYERMGFTFGQAMTLAATRMADGFYLDWHYVEGVMDTAIVGHDHLARDLVFDALT